MNMLMDSLAYEYAHGLTCTSAWPHIHSHTNTLVYTHTHTDMLIHSFKHINTHTYILTLITLIHVSI